LFVIVFRYYVEQILELGHLSEGQERVAT